MMKKFFAALATGVLLVSTQSAFAADSPRIQAMNDFDQLRARSTPIVEIIRSGIKYSESVLPFDGGLLISNFGSDMMNPRDDENKGFVLYYRDGMTFNLIPPGSGLRKPTAMAVKDKHLFVCDGDCLKVFRVDDFMEAVATPVKVIKFEDDDRVVNALALDGNTLYVSITNTNRIYTLDVSNVERPGKPKKFIELPGPNGLAVRDGVLYVATIPHDYEDFQANHVIYRVRLGAAPKVEKVLDVPGLYDGVALSDDGRMLYVSDWFTSAVQSIDLQTGERKLIYREQGVGPADIAQAGGVLYIPDLPGSRVIGIQVGHATPSPMASRR